MTILSDLQRMPGTLIKFFPCDPARQGLWLSFRSSRCIKAKVNHKGSPSPLSSHPRMDGQTHCQTRPSPSGLRDYRTRIPSRTVLMLRGMNEIMHGSGHVSDSSVNKINCNVLAESFLKSNLALQGLCCPGVKVSLRDRMEMGRISQLGQRPLTQQPFTQNKEALPPPMVLIADLNFLLAELTICI